MSSAKMITTSYVLKFAETQLYAPNPSHSHSVNHKALFPGHIHPGHCRFSIQLLLQKNLLISASPGYQLFGDLSSMSMSLKSYFFQKSNKHLSQLVPFAIVKFSPKRMSGYWNLANLLPKDAKWEGWIGKEFNYPAVTYPLAFGAFLCELVLITLHADDIVAPRDETLSTDGLVAFGAKEALLVPSPTLILILAHRGLEGLATTVATRRELLVKTVRTEDGFLLCCKRSVS